MGFLTITSQTLSWEEAKTIQETIKSYGVLQAIKLYSTFKDLQKDLEELSWGEEAEYHICKNLCKEEKAMVVSGGYKIIQKIVNQLDQDDFEYHDEFGSYMVEAIPKEPYSLYDWHSPAQACESLYNRRKLINDELSKEEMFLSSVSSWPRLGVDDFFCKIKDGLSDVNDYPNTLDTEKFSIHNSELTSDHPRFPAMIDSIRLRRGGKYGLNVPLFQEDDTAWEEVEDTKIPKEIHLDSLHYGLGAICLQVTFEAQNINHARYLHDSLISLGPIIGALGASAPIYKGQLSGWDFRWNVIAGLTDSRNSEELNPDSEKFVPCSRFWSNNHYISEHPNFSGKRINDGEKIEINQDWYESFKDSGMSDRLAYHFASLFSHDALIIYEDRIKYDSSSTEHFENLNSTNWNSVRLKPPPSYDSQIGWRVEFRPLDIQITDFENGAYVALLNLLTRVINDFDIDFSLPISLSNINMERAHQVDAVTKQKFWWRTNIVKEDSDYTTNPAKESGWVFFSEPGFDNFDSSWFKEMTISEILEGSECLSYKGIFPLIEEYISLNEFHSKDMTYCHKMLSFLSQRGLGEITTGARFQRDFVLNHPNYNQDSLVTDKIQYDLIKETTLLSSNQKWDENLLGLF